MGVVRGIAMAAALLVVILASPFREAVEPDTKHSTVAPFLLKGYNAFMVNIASSLPVRIPRFGPDGIMF